MVEFSSLMAPQVARIRPNAPIDVCARVLQGRPFRPLLVDGDDGLVGLLTTRDVFARGWLAGDTWIPLHPSDRWLRAGDLARYPEVLVTDEHDVADSLRAIVRSPERAAVVVGHSGTVAGLIAEIDAVRIAARLLPPDMGDCPLHLHPLVAIQSHTPLAEAGQLMERHEIRHVLVYLGARLVGVLSDHDVAIEGGLSKTQLCCGDVMQTPPITARDPLSLLDAASIMERAGIGSIPILGDGDEVLGLATRRGVVLALAHHLEVQRHRATSEDDLRRTC